MRDKNIEDILSYVTRKVTSYKSLSERAFHKFVTHIEQWTTNDLDDLLIVIHYIYENKYTEDFKLCELYINMYIILLPTEKKYYNEIESFFNYKNFVLSSEILNLYVGIAHESFKDKFKKLLNKYFKNIDNVQYLVLTKGDLQYIFPEIKLDIFLKLVKIISSSSCGWFIDKHLDEINELTDDNKNIIMRKLLSCGSDVLEKFCSKFNIKLNEEDLYYACQHDACSETIEYILKQKNIPSERCFNLILENGTHGFDLINLFLNYEYQLTYDNVVKLCELKFTIPNFDNHGVKIDNKIYLVCCNNNFFPDYVKKFKPTLEEFHEMFKQKLTISGIKRYVKKTKQTIDTTCLENACTIYDYHKIINYIVTECEIKSNLTCIKNFLESKSEFRKIEIFYNFIILNLKTLQSVDNFLSHDSTIIKIFLKLFDSIYGSYIRGSFWRDFDNLDTLHILIKNIEI
jgi:hypothetical protein